MCLCHLASLDFELPTKVSFVKVLYFHHCKKFWFCVCAPSNSLNNCSGSKVKLRYLSSKVLGVPLERVVQITERMVDLQNALSVKPKIQLLVPMFHLLLLRIKSLLFKCLHF